MTAEGRWLEEGEHYEERLCNRVETIGASPLGVHIHFDDGSEYFIGWQVLADKAPESVITVPAYNPSESDEADVRGDGIESDRTNGGER